jgi:hypothetical protein
MKWVDWSYLLDLPAPIEEVMQAVHTRCQFMGISYLMGLWCDYSQEVVAQFYATLYVDEDENEMHFTLGGKHFKSQFMILLNFSNLEVQPQPINSKVI